MPESEFRVAPPRQVGVAGLTLGVIGIKPGEGERLALLGVFDPEKGEPEQHRVRPGDEITVAGRTVRILDVVPGEEAHVDLSVCWAADQT